MTEQTTTVSHTDAKIAEVREDIAKLEAKLAALLTLKSNEAAIEGLTVGQVVSAEYGRAEKKRVITGSITAIGTDPKLGRMLALSVGEGLDVQIIKVRAADVVFNVAAANEEVAGA